MVAMRWSSSAFAAASNTFWSVIGDSLAGCLYSNVRVRVALFGRVGVK